MYNSPKITALALGAVILAGAYSSKDIDALTLNTDESILLGAANIVLIYFVLALIIERACEVSVDALTATDLLPHKTSAQDDAALAERRLVSVVICVVFGTGVSLAGLRLIEMILSLAVIEPVDLTGTFVAADTVLTGLILAGGSEGLHRILRRLLGAKSEIDTAT